MAPAPWPLAEDCPPPSTLDPASKSQLAAVLVALRKDLVACRLRPGTKLRIQVLSGEYGVSPGAVREALSRLVPEGLAEFSEQRGFRAAPISIAAMIDTTEARIHVDTRAIHLAIERGDADWEGDVLAAYHRLSRQSWATDDWIERHRSFHRTLVVACGSPWLLHFHDILHAHSERYRRLQSRYRLSGDPASQRDVGAEHERITQAVLRRDADAAALALDEHYRATMDKLRLVLSSPADENEEE